MTADDDMARFDNWDWVQRHWVANADFAVGDQHFIGYITNVTDVTRDSVDGTNDYRFNKFHQ
jgi:hypothetical protein